MAEFLKNLFNKNHNSKQGFDKYIYDIEPGMIITAPYGYGHPGYFKIYVIDVNKETETVSFKTKDDNGIDDFLSHMSILKFYSSYMKDYD